MCNWRYIIYITCAKFSPVTGKVCQEYVWRCSSRNVSCQHSYLTFTGKKWKTENGKTGGRKMENEEKGFSDELGRVRYRILSENLGVGGDVEILLS